MLKDTIAAVATPPGVGAIGIVRISGPGAERILYHFFRSSHSITHFKPRRLYHGDFSDPETGRLIDEVLISLMKAPQSYTGEDTLEISCHGGTLVLETILHAVLMNGARLAEPGEFTKRAFLNDRIDLTEAEAVGEIISAQTSKGLENALSQLKGRLRRKIETLRNDLIDVLVLLETSFDFTEEDMEAHSSSEILIKLDHFFNEIEALLRSYSQGKLYRQGASVVIAGKPNTGKSSLLNCLLQEKRAIVTPVPGTTRDFIEETVNILGIPVKLIDTAGIHSTDDLVEQEGIAMVLEKMTTADGIILLLDGSKPLTDEDRDIMIRLQDRPILPVVNKADLGHVLEEVEIASLIPDKEPLWISAKSGEGMTALKERIHELVSNMAGDTDKGVMINTVRHKVSLEKTLHFVSQAQQSLQEGLSQEFAALDIREALDALGEIAGETVTEDILDRIFSSFCVGK